MSHTNRYDKHSMLQRIVPSDKYVYWACELRHFNRACLLLERCP